LYRQMLCVGAKPIRSKTGWAAGELLMGLEPMTSSLPRTRSTTELQQPMFFGVTGSSWSSSGSGLVRRMKKRVEGIEPSSLAWKAIALPLSYTRNWPFGGFAGLTTGKDSFASRLTQGTPTGTGGKVGSAGFEPAKAVPSDLQSDPFDRSGNSPPRCQVRWFGRLFTETTHLAGPSDTGQRNRKTPPPYSSPF
jgi:hypothetical protein